MSRTGLRQRRAITGLMAGAMLISLAACGSSGTAKSTAAPAAGTSTPPVAAPSDAGAGAATSAPAKAGKGSADVAYSGAESGSLKAADSTCTVVNGELISFQAPADPNTTGPSIAATNSGTTWMMPVSTAAHPGGYGTGDAKGIKATKAGDSWTVTLTGTELVANYGDFPTLTLNGTIVCGEVVSAG